MVELWDKSSKELIQTSLLMMIKQLLGNILASIIKVCGKKDEDAVLVLRFLGNKLIFSFFFFRFYF